MSLMSGQRSSFNRKITPKCSDRCASSDHGNLVCASIIRGSSDEAIFYIRQVCASFSTILDSNGYTGLHVAAGCQKNKAVSYLIANGAKVNVQHEKSGNTALHFALLYGNVDTAHLLLKLGADPNIINLNGYSALSCLVEQQPVKVFNYPNDVMKLQVYAWGTNANYNLGLAKQYSGGIPECIDVDIKESDDIIEICPNKYHTLFRSRKGKVFACGHGQGGRLGMNIQSSVIVPLKIDHFKMKVLKMSAGVDHSVFMTENHQVWTCGKNSYMQLGFDPPPDYLCIPESLKLWFSKHPDIAKNVKGVGAGAYHTVFWTSTAIISFGLNGGQLGHSAGEQTPFIINPTIITSPRSLFYRLNVSYQIELVHVGDAAIIFSTSSGNVYIISNYETHCIIPFSKQFSREIKKLSCTGGTLDTKRKSWNDKYLSHHKSSLISVAILSSGNSVFIWSFNQSGHNFTIKNHWQKDYILDFCLNPIDIHFITASLQCFKVKCDIVSNNYELCQNAETSFKFKLDDPTFSEEIISSSDIQLPYLCRPYSIFSDPQGSNFFALQYVGRTFVKKKLTVTCESTYQDDFLQLYSKISDIDQACDVVIKTKGRTFPCHSYIISYHSSFFYKEVLANWDCVDVDTKIEINLEEIDPQIIETILFSLYCPESHKQLLSESFDSKSSDIFSSPNDTSDEEVEVRQSLSHRKTKQRKQKSTLNNFQQDVLNVMEKLGFEHFCYRGQRLLINTTAKNNIDRAIGKPSGFTFLRHKLSNLIDIWFHCNDKDDLLGAHRCVVIARCPYFEIYFSSRWATFEQESNENVIKIHCSYAAFKAILDYLYMDGVGHLKNLQVELLCEVFVNSNLYLLPRLQEMCEVLLSKRITLKNCLDILQFCHTYNAENLLHYVQEFLTLNIQHFLPLRSFKECDEECLAKFVKTYKEIIYKKKEHDPCRLTALEVPDRNLNFTSKFTGTFEYWPNAIQKFWIDTYSEHPTCTELQLGLSDDHLDFDETADGWVENFSPKQNKERKSKSGRKRHRPSTSSKEQLIEGRIRTTSSSSQVTTSSNSDNENENAQDNQEQFTFEDLTDREVGINNQEREEHWLIVGKKSLGLAEEKMLDLKIVAEKVEDLKIVSEKVEDLKIVAEKMEDLKILNVEQNGKNCLEETRDANENSLQAKKKLVSQTEVELGECKPSSPILFPSIQEAMTREVMAKISPLRGTSIKMPKMPKKMSSSKKKQLKLETDNEKPKVISPPIPAWGEILSKEVSVNLVDIMKSESEKSKKDKIAKDRDKPLLTKKKQNFKLDNITNVDEAKVKSPVMENKVWNIPDVINPCTDLGLSSSKLFERAQNSNGDAREASSSFHSIMKNEATMANSLIQSLNKPFHLIQWEEELAMVGLRANNPEENIAPTRRHPIVNPIWRKS